MLKSNFIYNSLELPAYWYATRAVKKIYAANWQISRLAYGAHPRQYALLVEGPTTTNSSPWVLYFHGGAWTFGTPAQFLPAARLFLEAGYRVVMPAYRRLPGIGFSGIWADIEQFFDYLQQRGDTQLAGPPSIVAGMSAGGHLAASLAWRQPWWEARGWGTAPEKVLLLGAVLDLDSMRHPGLRLLRGRKGSRTYDESNPLYWLKQGSRVAASHLLVHGTADGMAPFSQMHCSCASLKEKMENEQGLDLCILPNGSHLDACRWMYREDMVAERIRAFLAP